MSRKCPPQCRPIIEKSSPRDPLIVPRPGTSVNAFPLRSFPEPEAGKNLTKAIRKYPRGALRRLSAGGKERSAALPVFFRDEQIVEVVPAVDDDVGELGVHVPNLAP